MANGKVFKKDSREVDPTVGKTIREITGRPTRNLKRIGLEVEVEGTNFPKTGYIVDQESGDEHFYEDSGVIPKQWAYTHDGSLRGEDNAEYILREPLDFEQASEALYDLYGMFGAQGCRVDESHRTSVHVHLNVLDWKLNRVCSFLTLLFIVEDLLVHWCGEDRVGNLFCLRAKDAPAIISAAREFVRLGDSYTLRDNLHYSNVNLRAIHKKGSIEVRCMRGCSSPEPVLKWLAILHHIYELSDKYKDPRDIVSGFSGQSRAEFLSQVLGEHTEEVVNGCGMSDYQIGQSLHEGVRLVQPLVYSKNWAQYNKLKPMKDNAPIRKNKVSSSQFAFVTTFSDTGPVQVTAHDEDTI